MKKTTRLDINPRAYITLVKYQAINTFDLHLTQYVSIGMTSV